MVSHSTHNYLFLYLGHNCHFLEMCALVPCDYLLDVNWNCTFTKKKQDFYSKLIFKKYLFMLRICNKIFYFWYFSQIYILYYAKECLGLT